MNVSSQLDRGDLARITNQLLDEEFSEDQADDTELWLGEWNSYLSDFYDQDESVFLVLK